MRVLGTVFLAVFALACGGGGPSTPIAPEAPENCFTAAGNVCMTVPTISITCVDVPPGFLTNCSANVPMNIPTLINSSKISVGVGITGQDYILTTIIIVPNTAPGALTAQVPLQQVGAGCTTGVSSHYVEVYDGNYPTSLANGGRPLFVASVQTNMSCTH